MSNLICNFIVYFCNSAFFAASHSAGIYPCRVIFAAKNRLSSLFNAVLNVFFYSPQKQMRWINARRIVAVVTHAKTGLNFRFAFFFVGISMCQNKFSAMPKPSVSRFCFCRNPIPATIGFFNFIPKFLARIFESVDIFCFFRHNRFSVVNHSNVMVSMLGLGMASTTPSCFNLARN